MKQNYESQQSNSVEVHIARAKRLRAEVLSGLIQGFAQRFKNALSLRKAARCEQDVISEDAILSIGKPCY